MTDDEHATLGARIGRGRGVPWITVLGFACCVAVLTTWAVSAPVQVAASGRLE